MARMLGRYQVPGCCPGSRAGIPGVDCDGGWPVGTREAKRAENREVAEEIREAMTEQESGDVSEQEEEPVTDEVWAPSALAGLQGKEVPLTFNGEQVGTAKIVEAGPEGLRAEMKLDSPDAEPVSLDGRAPASFSFREQESAE